ncbi:MAG: rRNA maturation RNase YbeY [Candidatus Woesearchaeota archaeon]
MLTIPSIPRGYGPWNFKCIGPGPKNIKFLIQEIIKTVLVYEKIKKSEVYIDIYLNTPERMSEFHKKYLKKEGPTDTISLVMDNKTIYEPMPTMLGIINLCWQVIKDDAEHIKQDEIKHLAHITVHSTLHLLGYDHEEEEDRKKMEAKETLILSKLGIGNPYLKMKSMDKEEDNDDEEDQF